MTVSNDGGFIDELSVVTLLLESLDEVSVQFEAKSDERQILFRWNVRSVQSYSFVFEVIDAQDDEMNCTTDSTGNKDDDFHSHHSSTYDSAADTEFRKW